MAVRPGLRPWLWPAGIGLRMSHKERERSSLLAVNVGLAANILLAFLKTSVGVVGHSPALLADGINSTSDVAYNLVVAVFVRRAGKPADHDHPYGHRQLETIAALIVGSFVITAAIAIFWNAIGSIYDMWAGVSDFGGATGPALWVGALTVLFKVGLRYFTQRIGLRTGNAAVMALAYDHRNDIFSALAATAGIYLGQLGHFWVDPLAGALVALFVLRTGIEILRESSDDLMDTVPGTTLASRITSLLNQVPGVEQVEEIHAHRFGPYLVVNVTIGVAGGISVTAGDQIASQVEQQLYRHIDLLRRVYVHYHPACAAAVAPGAGPSITCQPHDRQSSQTFADKPAG
jgi:cation diffusion facilitator family transporter